MNIALRSRSRGWRRLRAAASVKSEPAVQKGPLTPTDMAALAVIARNLVEAHERRNAVTRFVTLNERAAFDSLRANIDSLVRNRRV